MNGWISRSLQSNGENITDSRRVRIVRYLSVWKRDLCNSKIWQVKLTMKVV